MVYRTLEPLTKENMQMDNHTMQVKTTNAVVAGIVIPILAITVACLIGIIDGHRADIEIARQAAARSREDAAKAMWEHMQSVPAAPSSK